MALFQIEGFVVINRLIVALNFHKYFWLDFLLYSRAGSHVYFILLQDLFNGLVGAFDFFVILSYFILGVSASLEPVLLDLSTDVVPLFACPSLHVSAQVIPDHLQVVFLEVASQLVDGPMPSICQDEFFKFLFSLAIFLLPLGLQLEIASLLALLSQLL